jgi:hypothetical protein
MPKQENNAELTQEDLQNIANFVTEGYTEGKFTDDNGKNVYWKLETSVWRN